MAVGLDSAVDGYWVPGRTWQRWDGQRLCLRGSDRGWVILRSNIRGVKANGGRGGVAWMCTGKIDGEAVVGSLM